jgi:regulator of protease activity HflC (stomatin/prohibitin superfamily)
MNRRGAAVDCANDAVACAHTPTFTRGEADGNGRETHLGASIVEIKDVEIPAQMQHAMARQAEAERERRAKVINAEGEFQASERLYDAAQIMSANPTALQLRYLQTLVELGSSEASTIVFPMPIDLLRPLTEKVNANGAKGAVAMTQ